MTNEDYRKEFQLLKDNLADHLAIYHERVTLLVRLTIFDIGEEGVTFKAKIIKPLNKNHAERNRMYKSMMSMGEFSFGASYQFGPDSNVELLEDKKVGRPYCPFTLWLDPDLAQFVLESDDEITKEVADYILENKDWTVLRSEID